LLAAIERLLDEGAGRVRALAARVRRPELRLAFRRVDPVDRHFVHSELARGLREDRLHHHDALHAAGLALRAPRRRVGEHRDAAPPHRRRLIEQRDGAAGHAGVALRLVRAVLVDDEHVERGDAAVFSKPALMRPCTAGRAPPMPCSVSRSMRIITGAFSFFDRRAGIIAVIVPVALLPKPPPVYSLMTTTSFGSRCSQRDIDPTVCTTLCVEQWM